MEEEAVAEEPVVLHPLAAVVEMAVPVEEEDDLVRQALAVAVMVVMVVLMEEAEAVEIVLSLPVATVVMVAPTEAVEDAERPDLVHKGVEDLAELMEVPVAIAEMLDKTDTHSIQVLLRSFRSFYSQRL